MAENIINSKGLTEKALESAETFAVPEKVDAGAADKFGSLLSGDADGQHVIAFLFRKARIELNLTP
ncbi:hypothetical protein [Endozoicomonas sp. SESOKO4]|uniref:hypothetical protein n=1 Tax=Endozoicomonas sp. SESOKO4 TaxID=2828745 RepID=UPI0021495F69|nr:hypothetical protein [Endozoicomonas sp. SESOKO4]